MIAHARTGMMRLQSTCGVRHRQTSPDIPARLVELQMSVGLLTDGSWSFSAFPGWCPVASLRRYSPPTVAGAVSFRGPSRGEFPVIPLREPTAVPSELLRTHQVAEMTLETDGGEPVGVSPRRNVHWGEGCGRAWPTVRMNGDPDRNRTCDLQIRNLPLYPTELRDQPRRHIAASDDFANGFRTIFQRHRPVRDGPRWRRRTNGHGRGGQAMGRGGSISPIFCALGAGTPRRRNGQNACRPSPEQANIWRGCRNG